MNRLYPACLCIAAVLLLSVDKYSWGAVNPTFGVLGDYPVGVRTWQSVVAFGLGTTLIAAVSAASSHPRWALWALRAELVGFLAFNSALVARDGLARLAEWGYAKTSVGLFVLVGGLAVRGILLALVSGQARAARSNLA